MNQTKILLVLALFLAALLLLRALLKRDKCDASPLKLDDLLLGDDGKMSKAAAIMMGSFAFTTWMMGYLTIMGKMTEGYAAIYIGGWVTPTVVKLITGRPQQPPQPIAQANSPGSVAVAGTPNVAP